jgi:hypothetical protein
MLPPRKPAMPTPDLEGQLLEDPPEDMIPARNAREVEEITQELLMRMQSASPEEKAQIATMTQPFMDALSQLPPEARDEYMQMAGGLPMLMGDEAMDDGSRYEPPSSGLPNEMPMPIPEGAPSSGRPDTIPAYMARQQDMPSTGQGQGLDLMALMGGGNMPQQPMNMGSGQRFLGGLMG